MQMWDSPAGVWTDRLDQKGPRAADSDSHGCRDPSNRVYDGCKLGFARAEQPFPMSPRDDERSAWRKQIVAEGFEMRRRGPRIQSSSPDLLG